MTEKLAAGIDIGSTNFRIGVVSKYGKILSKHMAMVGAKRSPADVVAIIRHHVGELREDYPKISGVGIGIPGIVDWERGLVYSSPHYLEWVDVDFKTLFRGALDLPVVLDNDANMAALGEGWMGAARGLSNYIVVTLGTGIGGGIVSEGRLMHGDMGFAGEIGHIVLDFNGPRCACGGRGCFEMYSSATGLHNLVVNSKEPDKTRLLAAIGNDYDNVTAELIFDMARDGDIFASTIWKKFGAYLGAGIASLVNTTGIFNVIVGGGVSRAWDFFIGEATKELAKRTYKKSASLTRLHRAELLDDAGVLGSAKEVFQILD